MKIQYFVASMVVAAVMVAPMAYSAPGGGMENTRFLNRNTTVSFRGGDVHHSDVIIDFHGESWDDLSGAHGWVVYTYMGYNEYYDISCSGPDYANAISVDNNGNSTVNVTLDPNNETCNSYGIDSPITLKFVGKADGNYTESSNGNGRQTVGGTTYKYNTQYNNWSQTLSESFGYPTIAFSSISRKINRVQVPQSAE